MAMRTGPTRTSATLWRPALRRAPGAGPRRSNWEVLEMAAPKKGAGAPKFALDPSVTLTESEGKSLLKRRDQKTDAREITVQPAANAGLWAVGDYTQQNKLSVSRLQLCTSV